MKKAKISLIFAAILVLSTPAVALAASGAGTLTCSNVDGASLFGYDGDNYVYIGSISNKFDSNSIADEFGSYGSEFSSNSIFDEFGHWGSEFASYSATNSFSSKPPLIVSKNFEKIGYLTANDFRSPSMNIFVAKFCASNSSASSESGQVDLKFSDESDMGNLSVPNLNLGTPSPIVCPANSAPGPDGSCHCNIGYAASSDKASCILLPPTCNDGVEKSGVCLTHTQDCAATYGSNVYGTASTDPKSASSCYCSAGYQWNSTTTACVAQTLAQCPGGSILNASGNCVCSNGYFWDSTLSICSKTITATATITPPTANNLTASDNGLSDRLKGQILLQVEDSGKAWYVRPDDGLRYYMADGTAAYQMMRSFGLGITDSDLATVPAVDDSASMKSSASACLSNPLAKKLAGKILLQVQQHGEAWYVYPDKCRRIYLKDGATAYSVMRYLSLGISNTDIEQIATGTIRQ